MLQLWLLNYAMWMFVQGLLGYPVHMSNFGGLQARGSRSLFYTIINFVNWGMNKLIMMQKLEARAVDLKPTKIGHVHWTGW